MSTAITRTEIVDGWTLGFANDAEPRVRDIDLGDRLGYARPKDIRLLARKHEDAGNINPFHVRAAVALTGAVQRYEDELWFAEADALFLMSQSGTQKSVELTKEMIALFIKLRANAIERPAFDLTLIASIVAAAVTPIADAIKLLANDQRALRDEMRLLGSGSITGMQRDELATLVTKLAGIRSAMNGKSLRSCRASIQNQLGGIAKWNGSGRTWATMPASSFPDVKASLRVWIRDDEVSASGIATAKAVSEAAAKQGLLFGKVA